MPPKKTLYSSDSCEHCDDAKKILKSRIDSGEIEVVDVDKNPEIKERIDREYGGWPTLTVVEGNKECEMDIETGKKIKCVRKD